MKKTAFPFTRPLTRRHILTRLTALTALAPVAGLFGSPAQAAAPVASDLESADLRALLQVLLDGLSLPVSPARLEAIEVTHMPPTDAQNLHLRALVRLTWSPGVRQYYIAAEGPDLEAALRALSQAAYLSVVRAAGPARPQTSA